MIEAAILDSDTLSEISRGQVKVSARARAYLEHQGRLTISAVTVYERLRGYRAALLQGKPYEAHLREFEALISQCNVLPVDGAVADAAATIWAHLGPSRRKAQGNIFIAATAAVHRLSLVTRNRKDYAPMMAAEGIVIELSDWTK